ncbi:tRNA 2-thiouridine(34) synthase MnmA [Hippea maritima]|uniref:tRNA-specific 2-thiouridylase MnmA n=1 Tax=Hippea maritima (strain ATCC 700847 / DSM 10411 / MH2) TaxID=760142 RepID=F2LXH2_HIPMA|nr:tRNA 2-thiouridine(34) synthase MnmA [Hippea maritima]AEA33158.1 tRNA-specific 2-thiouridylase mnmA [Hippea maritima DSM 10411]
MKVAVALSGGVDSATAAFLLKKEGHEVVGITLKLYDDESYIKQAEKIAEFLGIEWHCFDYSLEFKKGVIDYFFNTYLNGKTPNPCVVCNRYVKFNYLLEVADKLNCDKLATGHYARISRKLLNKPLIAKSPSEKDQSYFLCFLNESQIKKLMFPLGELNSKETTRQIAEKINLSLAQKKDSFDVCFVRGNYRDLLKNRLKEKEGYFILSGKKIKKHEGIFSYTVGQRKGLRIAYKEALYVKSIHPKTGNIYLSTKKELYKRTVRASVENLLYAPSEKFKAKAKLRSKMDKAFCTITLDKKSFLMEFDHPVFAPTPGQVACVYLEDVVILAGFIEEAFD